MNIKRSQKKSIYHFCRMLFILFFQLYKNCSVSPGGFRLKHAQKMKKTLKNQRLCQSFQFQKETIGIKVPEGNKKTAHNQC